MSRVLKTVMATFAVVAGILIAAPAANAQPGAGAQSFQLEVTDPYHACVFSVSGEARSDAGEGLFLVAQTGTGSFAPDGCSKKWGSPGRALVQIVCAAGASATISDNDVVSTAINVGPPGVGDYSCYARHRVSRTGLNGDFGHECRIPWTRFGGWKAAEVDCSRLP